MYIGMRIVSMYNNYYDSTEYLKLFTKKVLGLP